ncbi:ROK family protein [Solidesulfovibrio sp.]
MQIHLIFYRFSEIKFHFNPTNSIDMIEINGPIGAIEAGGTKFVCAFGSSLEDIKCSNNRIELPTGDNPHETLAKVIQWFKRKEIQHGQSLKSIGIASFGPICLDKASPKYGYITTTPKPNWSNFDIVGTVQSDFPGITIGFDTDVNGAALGEWQWGAAQGLDDFVYITIGTGIGAGGMTNGKLMHGMMHPEMGHMILRRIHGDSFPGVCIYHNDCWEGLCSGVAISARTGIPAESLTADSEAWAYEAQYTAQAIVNIIYILSPQRIILGGSVSKGGKIGQSSFIKTLQKKTINLLNNYMPSDNAIHSIHRDFIVPPILGDLSGISGAFILGNHSAQQ